MGMNIHLGTNTLPFYDYKKGKVVTSDFDVVYIVRPPMSRMLVIIVQKKCFYQDLYYNESQGVFKILSEDGDSLTPSQWWKEEMVGVDCPEILDRAGVRNWIINDIFA